jgi:acyl-CoA thioesterase
MTPLWDRFPIQSKFEEWRCPGYSLPHALFVEGASPEAAVWLRMTDDVRHDDGRFETAALALVADRAPGPHLGPCLEPPPDIEFAPRPLVSLEMSLRVYGEPATDWLLLHSRVDEASNGHVATRVDIWDEEMDLIATSEQLARYGSKPLA